MLYKGGMQVLAFLTGALDGAMRGGAAGVACGPLAEVCSPALAVAGAAIEGYAAAQTAGIMAEAAYTLNSDNNNAPRSGNSGFANKRTLQETRIKGNDVSVDAERGGSGSWNVHVKVNGEKTYITDPADLSGLPGSVRKSADVQRAIQEAFDYIAKAQQ
jgi:hypothetical protein